METGPGSSGRGVDPPFWFHEMLGIRLAIKFPQVGPLGLTILRVSFQLASKRSQF